MQYVPLLDLAVTREISETASSIASNATAGSPPSPSFHHSPTSQLFPFSTLCADDMHHGLPTSARILALKLTYHARLIAFVHKQWLLSFRKKGGKTASCRSFDNRQSRSIKMASEPGLYETNAVQALYRSGCIFNQITMHACPLAGKCPK